jgi:hypothetical protein
MMPAPPLGSRHWSHEFPKIPPGEGNVAKEDEWWDWAYNTAAAFNHVPKPPPNTTWRPIEVPRVWVAQ